MAVPSSQNSSSSPLIGAIAARSRWRGVPAAATDLRPLRHSSSFELSLAVVALFVAALLGTLAPPVSTASTGLRGMSASGSDVEKSVHVRLTTVSDQPGANRFTAQIDDVRAGSALRGANVSLLFTPLDDPGVASSSLGLSPASNGTYVGSGPNLKFDGRWGVRVLVAAGGKTVEVPLELDPIGPPQQLSVERIPGRPPTYSHLVGINDVIGISPDPERAGPSKLSVTIYQLALGSEERIDRFVVTLTTGGHGPVAPAAGAAGRRRHIRQQARAALRPQRDRGDRASPRRHAAAQRVRPPGAWRLTPPDIC